jgi:uncharacterized protein RhaS with RHS repeats
MCLAKGLISIAYNYFRDYDPSVGRYVESDPAGLAAGVNTYAYVRSAPILWKDRLGLADSITDGIEAAIVRGDAQALQALIEGGALNPAQEAAAQAGLRTIQIMGRTTTNTDRLAEFFNKTQKQVRRAIEQCKQDNLPRNGPIRNPDVRVDPITGEVYPQLPSGGIGDSIGNIFDYLK